MKVLVKRTLNCAHQLPGTAMHGHTYRITFIASGPPNDKGYIQHFSEKPFSFEVFQDAIASCITHLDHGRLEVLIGTPATAERLAVYLARGASKALDRIIDVRVEVGDDGVVETEMMQRDGEYFSI